jgi:hypothetical protein
MKKLILLTLAVSAFGHSYAQAPVQATFEDGTILTYRVIDMTGDHQLANTIGLGSCSDDKSISGFQLMFSRFDDNKYFASADIAFSPGTGFKKFEAGGIYFLGAMKEKNYHLPANLKTVVITRNMETHYIVRIDAVKNKHFGLHVEAGYGKYDVTNLAPTVGEHSYTVNSLSSPAIAVGLGYLSVKSGLMQVENKVYMRGQSLFTITGDILLHPGINYAYTQTDTLPSTTLESADFLHKGVGFQVFLTGQNTFTTHRKKTEPQGLIGLRWRIGVVKSIYAPASSLVIGTNGMTIAADLGIMYTFGH